MGSLAVQVEEGTFTGLSCGCLLSVELPLLSANGRVLVAFKTKFSFLLLLFLTLSLI